MRLTFGYQPLTLCPSGLKSMYIRWYGERESPRVAGGRKMRRLMVVAHPDDEVIFGGAHLLQERHWKVICITNGDNPVRSREFKKVMRLVGADYEIWNYRDTYSDAFDITNLRRDLQRLMQQNRFEMVVTHGLKGEYGHPQHKVIARLMRSLVPHNLYAFAVGKRVLAQSVLSKKKQLLEVYRSQRKTIRELRRDNKLDNFIGREYFILIKK